MVRQNIPLDENREMPIEQARELGAIALFGEKYGDKVRVVRFGPSCELCGGIHARATGNIGFFKIINESSIAAGIRRIEAITGKRCEENLYIMIDMLKGIREMFNNAKDLQGVLQKYVNEHDSMKKQIEGFQAQAIERMKEQLLQKVQNINGIHVVRAILPVKPELAKDLVFKVSNEFGERGLCVIGSVFDGKSLLNVMISQDMVSEMGLNAGQMIREAAKFIKGGGGGQPHFASAGGKDPDGISAAVDKIVSMAVK